MTKNKKALIVAGAAALGLVAATGVTSGLAWFATNSTVSVTGLAVQANTTDSFLLIAEGSVEPNTETTGIRALNQTSVASSLGTVNLKPVTYTGSTEAANLTTSAIETADQETNTKYKWGTGTSASVNDANTESAITKIAKGESPNGTFATDVAGDGKYVSVAEFSVCLATGSAGCAGLKVTAVDIKNGANPATDSVWATTGLTLILATTTTGYQYKVTNASLSNQIWSSPMTSSDTTSVKIKAYVYIDGTSEGVKTAAIDNLKGTIGFSISTVPNA